MTAPLFSETATPALPEGATPHSPASEPESPARPRRINPYRMFVGSFVPNWLLCRVEISQGAKLAYARLAQYSGQNGECFPHQETLAAELGVSERQARNYLRELGEFALVESVQVGLRKPNDYYFLDHSWIHEAGPDAMLCPTDQQSVSAPDRKNPSGQDRQGTSAPTGEENQREENQSTECLAENWPLPERGETRSAAGGQPRAAFCAQHIQTVKILRRQRHRSCRI